jgi:hypothetical protein
LVKTHRKRYAAIEESDRAILLMIRRLKAEHPFWGYRRVWAYMNFIERVAINKKRVYRLLRKNDLLVKGNEKLKAKRRQFFVLKNLTVSDYDGDSKTDIAIYRDGGWFILNSTNGFAALGFGTATDKPVPNSFVP